MSYQRKTIDTWQFWTNYGYGWEHEHTDTTYRAMVVNRKAYRENAGCQLRIVRKRERIENLSEYERKELNV